MGPRCSSAETQVCHRSYIIAARGRWFSPGTLVSSTDKIDRHDIAEILLKVALNTITLTSSNVKNALRDED